MPEIEDATTDVNRLDLILRNHTRDLTLHLVQAPFDSSGAGAAIEDCDFPGYAEQRNVFRDISRVDGVATTLHCRTHFLRAEDGPPQNAVGCYVSWRSPSDGRGILFAENFPTPVRFENAGDGLLLEVSLEAFRIEGGDVPTFGLRGISAVMPWKGGSTLYALSGQDKALMETTLGCLDGLLRRDSTLSDLSRRSERSRVPLVPPADAELLAAVTLVRQRLATLLAAAT